MPTKPNFILPPIYSVRSRQVVLDSDLALLFGVPTHRLNEQIRRNADRFPADFAFILTQAESASLISQFAISKPGRGGRRKPPLALTEHGVVMAANVLKSRRASAMSIEVVREFIRLRRATQHVRALRRKVAQLESAVTSRLDQHDEEIGRLFRTVQALLEGESTREDSIKKIGFAP